MSNFKGEDIVSEGDDDNDDGEPDEDLFLLEKLQLIEELSTMYRKIRRANHYPMVRKGSDVSYKEFNTTARLILESMIDVAKLDSNHYVIPKFSRFGNTFRCNNASDVFTTFIEGKRQRLADIGICCRNVSAYTSTKLLFEKICQNHVNLESMSIVQVRQICMWFSNYNPVDMYNYLQSNKYIFNDEFASDFWMNIANYIILSNFRDVELLDKVMCLSNINAETYDVESDDDITHAVENSSAFVYLICLGTYLVNGKYRILFKIGKSNRDKSLATARFFEHAMNANFPDIGVYQIYRCANETQLENLLHKRMANVKVTWYKEQEVFDISAMYKMKMLVGCVEAYIERSATNEKLRNAEEEIDKQTNELLEHKEKVESLQLDVYEKNQEIEKMKIQKDEQQEKFEKNKLEFEMQIMILEANYKREIDALKAR